MFFKLLFSIIFLLVLYLLHKIIIKPYLALRYYKKQGFTSYFFPIMGMRKLMKEAEEKYHDVQYYRKHFMVDFPGSRGMVTNFFDKPCLFLADTALKRDYFVNKQPYYTKLPFLQDFLRIDAIEKRPSLILAEGDDWKRIRKILSQAFNQDFIASNMPLMNSIASEVFSQIDDLENVNLINEFQKITGNVILSSMLGEDFLGRKYNGESAPLVITKINSQISGRRLNLITLLFGKRFTQKVIPSFRREIQYQEDFFRNFLMKYLEEKYESFKIKAKENPFCEEKYLIDSLFKLVLKEEEHFSLLEMCSNINILFLAGTDTTGHLLGHLVYVLGKHPEVYKTLMEELGKNSNAIEKNDFDVIRNLEYLNAVIKEGLRYVTPASEAFGRVAIKDHKLGDLFIKKGTNIVLGMSLNSFDPSIFREPFVFRPERWVKGHEMFENAEEKNPYCYLPFSAGARNCIGQHMAILEAKIILAKFLIKFEFEMKVKEPITWVLRFVTEPKDPLIAKLTLRKK